MFNRPKQVFLVHGEEKSAQALKLPLNDRLYGMEIHIPSMSNRYTV